jgi:putative hydrolase of the HAD superfamily
MITHIYFDWSKTLAFPKTRDIFIGTSTLSILYPDTLSTLTYLKTKGYTLGLISNTHKNPEQFIEALSKSGLMPFLSQDDVSPEHAVMVGDNYQADVLGALRVGMNAIHVNRDHEKTLKSKSNTGMGGTNVLTVKNIGDLKNYF